MSEAKKQYKIEGRPSTIYRTVKNKDNPYVIIDRRPINNSKLSFKAKGILTYLMSRPDGWEVSVTDLVNHSTDGEASIRSGLKELREAGHMKYTTSRQEGRITGWLIEVYEVPQAELITNSPDGDFQQVENLHVENQDVENRTQVLKTLNSNKKEVIKKTEDGEIFKLYEQNIGPLTPMIRDRLGDMLDEYGNIFLADAITEAAERNARNIKYIEACCRNWKANGRAAKKPAGKKPTNNTPIRRLD